MGNLKEKLSIERWKVYLSTFVLIAGIIGWMVNTVYSMATVEQRMFDTPEQKQAMLKEVDLNSSHRKDEDVHMAFQKTMEIFVYKPEYEKDMIEVNKKLDMIIEIMVKKSK